MKHKREIIEALLSGLSSMEEFYDSPDVICRHFSNWIDSVKQILASADMNDELNSWNKALNGTIYSDDGSLWVAMSIAKATLIGILNKLETTEIFNTPYLNHEDVFSADRMSSLYVILHCYENSVRCFIEKIFLKELGDNWWEQVANSQMLEKVERVKNKEIKNKWVSPRGGSSPLYCIDWGDLARLIKNNKEFFLPYIGDINFIENRFTQLEDLRNIVAHHGILPSEDDFQRVFISFRDWCRQIGQHKNL
ncbi:Swt1 family HEPN domain-containing protein [Nostoc sp. ChiSLP03a]|uniref:Swt1 family HEPN domain-containing protein n=1 Tax=Nostoc sp. ChiSLP03a TaxID=3075380 RepID=UPI002AD2FAF8|nr:Swt1 family HEPN domain-containing protein [Nostoc sp. ChiSLP03a]MDZ8214449.1 Swt1 family HEPN domain-containing protein [Nostoc sp. ChiSLP03a]